MSTDSESYSESVYSSGAIYGPDPIRPWDFVVPVVNGARKTEDTPKSVIFNTRSDLSNKRFSKGFKNYKNPTRFQVAMRHSHRM